MLFFRARGSIRGSGRLGDGSVAAVVPARRHRPSLVIMSTGTRAAALRVYDTCSLSRGLKGINIPPFTVIVMHYDCKTDY